MLELAQGIVVPEQASTMAGEVDALYFFLIGVSTFFTLLIVFLIAYFAVKYRRRSEAERPGTVHAALWMEFVWIGVPFAISMVMFGWGADLFFRLARPPANALDVYCVGRQWMWKFQHLDGQREINDLHVPIGRPVRLVMTSEDVIHSVFVPAFRVKQDVLPGRYTTLWFEAKKAGTYHLFCTEYCGTKHSGMIGKVVVMEPARFQAWLSGGTEGSMASLGEKIYQSLGCHSCHRADAQARGPALEGLFGKTVTLADGRSVVADESYLRESILTPATKVVAGFEPIMPTFAGQLTEEQVLQVIAYLKTLEDKETRQVPPPRPGGPVPPALQPSPAPPAPPEQPTPPKEDR